MNEKQFTISEVIDSFGITKHSLGSLFYHPIARPGTRRL